MVTLLAYTPPPPKFVPMVPPSFPVQGAPSPQLPPELDSHRGELKKDSDRVWSGQMDGVGKHGRGSTGGWRGGEQ